MHALVTVLLMALALPVASAIAADPSATESSKTNAPGAAAAASEGTKGVMQATRETWQKMRATFGNDPEAYRRGAEQKLKELDAMIAELRTHTAGVDRNYFLTRVESLEQHLKYAREQFASLPQEEIQKGRDGLRHRLDIIIGFLEDYVEMARKEAVDFTTMPKS